MNIFVLDDDITKCARYHCDSHVTKMILEYTQILSTVNRSLGMDEGYKMTHLNHPCVVWARECLDNWYYVMALCEALNKEFIYRRGKSHASWKVACRLTPPNLPMKGSITDFAQAMPNDVKNADYILAYRNYYIKYKQHLAKWSSREEPEWFNHEGILLKER